MNDQLHHMIELSNLSNVTIQVLPFAAGAHPAMDAAGGSFAGRRRDRRSWGRPGVGPGSLLEYMGAASSTEPFLVLCRPTDMTWPSVMTV